MREIKHIVIHCSATPDGKVVTVDDIDRMHRERGFKRIGYHFVIELDGTRKPGRALVDIGAHVEGSNAHSIGICMIGTARFSEAQWDALYTLVRELEYEFPQAVVLGHRDFSPDLDGDGIIEPWEWFKLCPGFDVAAWRMGGMESLWNHAHLYTPPAPPGPT